jgi:hypothetical protein
VILGVRRMGARNCQETAVEHGIAEVARSPTASTGGSPSPVGTATGSRPAAVAKVPSADELTGLAEMYVADERFAANHGGAEGAGYVRDALTQLAITELG